VAGDVFGMYLQRQTGDRLVDLIGANDELRDFARMELGGFEPPTSWVR
jgi:hypothetical protein